MTMIPTFKSAAAAAVLAATTLAGMPSGAALAQDRPATTRLDCKTAEGTYRLDLPTGGDAETAKVDDQSVSISVHADIISIGYRAFSGERVVITIGRQDNSFRKQTYIIPYQYARTETGRCVRRETTGFAS